MNQIRKEQKDATLWSFSYAATPPKCAAECQQPLTCTSLPKATSFGASGLSAHFYLAVFRAPTPARAHTPQHISLLPAVNAKQKELLTKFPPLSILLLAVLLNHYKRGEEKPTTTHPFPLRSLPTVATSSVP
ncbi:unnamed protein product [Musa textilis]